MLFSEVIGQQQYKDALIQAALGNHLSHALLLLAPEGAGGLPLAMALAQYLVCTDKQDGESCGQCAGCKKAAKMVHPDVHFSYPVVPQKAGEPPLSSDYGKEWREYMLAHPYSSTYDWLQFIGAENRQGNISAKECQEIIHVLGLKSYESDYKVMIIWRPEYLRANGNRLLKLLEEPPEKTVFILVAEQADQILNTILSRTQLIRMSALAEADLAAALMQRHGLDEKAARQTAALAEGSFHAALHLMNQDTTDYMTRLRAWLNAIVSKKPGLLHAWIADLSASKMGREEQKQFLRYFIKQLEHTLRGQYGGKDQRSILPEEVSFTATLTKLADFYQIREMIGLLDAASYHIERNANAKILFHALSLRLRYIFNGQPAPL